MLRTTDFGLRTSVSLWCLPKKDRAATNSCLSLLQKGQAGIPGRAVQLLLALVYGQRLSILDFGFWILDSAIACRHCPKGFCRMNCKKMGAATMIPTQGMMKKINGMRILMGALSAVRSARVKR